MSLSLRTCCFLLIVGLVIIVGSDVFAIVVAGLVWLGFKLVIVIVIAVIVVIAIVIAVIVIIVIVIVVIVIVIAVIDVLVIAVIVWLWTYYSNLSMYSSVELPSCQLPE